MIETKRLVLRKWKLSDAEDLFTWAKDPEVGPAAGWPPHKSVEASKDVIENVLNGPECYAICERGSDTPIGAVELMLKGHNDFVREKDECELGYWLAKPFWGKGYMPEAAEALMKRGFSELGMHTIWCRYYEGNAKSKRVQEKLGFFYHHTDKEVPVTLLNEVRTEHTNIMSVYDFCYKKNSYTKGIDCGKCPHKNKCSLYSEIEFRR